MKSTYLLLVLPTILALTSVANAEITYSVSDRKLHVPLTPTGGVPYANIALNNGLVSIPAVTVDGAPYTNVVLRLDADNLFSLVSGAPLVGSCVTAPAGSTTYNVGADAGQLPSIASVDWNNLQPGDMVRIHWRATPYAEKILLSASGTAAKPIRVCGVAGGPGGNTMPVITGQNATTRADLAFQNPDGLAQLDPADPTSLYSVLEVLGLVTIQDKVYEQKPSNIIIEGLHLTGANEYNTSTSADGTVVRYWPFAACIRVQKGDNIVIRGNELSDCGNAIFAVSRDAEPQTSRNLLIEGNYIHGNGAVGNASIHAMYIQTIGATVQYNYFGPHRAGASGGQYKDRSVGSVVRYNYFASAARILDFVEPEDYDTSIDPRAWDGYVAVNGTRDMPTLASVVAAADASLRTYVYGNFLNNTFAEGHGAYTPVHWSNDNYITNAYGEVVGRHGKLYFFNNTLVTTADYRSDDFGATRTAIFDQGVGSSFTKASSIEAFNNVFHLETRPQGGNIAEFFLARHDFERINLGKNWITGTWQAQGPDRADVGDPIGPLGLDGSGVITGSANFITGAVSPVDPITLLATPAGRTILKGAGGALPTELNGLLDHEFQVNHTNPLLSKAVSRDPATTTDLGAAAVP